MMTAQEMALQLLVTAMEQGYLHKPAQNSYQDDASHYGANEEFVQHLGELVQSLTAQLSAS